MTKNNSLENNLSLIVESKNSSLDKLILYETINVELLKK
jgi:hypothetical protein